MEIDIRQARSKDRARIEHLIHEHADTLAQSHLPKTREFFVAVEGKKAKENIVGCCALVVYGKRLAEIRSLAVEETSRTRGVASRLVDACVAKAEQEEITEVLATSTEAVGFFKKRGFSTDRGARVALWKETRTAKS